MLLWLALGAAAFIALGLLALYFLPWSLRLNLQGRFEPSGTWALALGLGLGPIALSAISARGVSPFVTCHVFGRQLLRLPLSRWLSRKARPATEHSQAAEPAPLTRAERGVARWVSSLDPLEILASLLLGQARLFEVRSLTLEVSYGCRDVALTGRILAILCVLSGILPEHYVIRQTPCWESEDRVVMAVDGVFRIWPGRVLIGVVRSLAKHRSQASRDAATVAQST